MFICHECQCDAQERCCERLAKDGVVADVSEDTLADEFLQSFVNYVRRLKHVLCARHVVCSRVCG